MNVNQLAEAILKEVGGKGNIKELFHCVTRLRFYLKDRSVIDAERIKKLEGVLGGAASDHHRERRGECVQRHDQQGRVCDGRRDGGEETEDAHRRPV